MGTWGRRRLTARTRHERRFDDAPAAELFARSLRSPAAVLAEGGGWTVYEVEVEGRGRFTRDAVEAVSGSGQSSVVPAGRFVHAFVTEDGHRLIGVSPGAGAAIRDPLRDDVEPHGAWQEMFGEGLATLDGAEFLAAFEMAMADGAGVALRRSEAEVRAKRARLDGGPSLRELGRFRLVAAQVAEADGEILGLTSALLRPFDPMAGPEGAAVTPARPDGEELAGIEARRAEVAATREALLDLEPMLRRFDDRGEVAGLSNEALLERLGGDCDGVLEAIIRTRARLGAGKLSLWSNEAIVARTAARLNVAAPEHLELLAGKQTKAARAEAWTAIGLAAISIGLGVAAAIATAGSAVPTWAAVTLTAGAAGLGGVDAAVATADFQERRDAAGTDLDPTKSLLPDDLEGEWAALTLAWIGVGIDAADVIRAVRLVSSGSRLHEVAEELAVQTGADRETLIRAADEARGGGDLATSPALADPRAGVRHHVGRFRAGASYLIPRSKYDKWIADAASIGRADGLFVTTSEAMDRLLREADGDLDAVKRKLGIPPDAWNEPLVRVDVLNPLEHNARLPSGFEEGANSEFVWGGYTSGGMPEVVLDPVSRGAFQVTTTEIKP